ncbi:hypothetical protein BDP27DRAFT_1155612, partial [Rhodocollybia butyracea]
MLLWIRGAFSPQEIHDRLLDSNSTFNKNLVSYLESTFSGDFITGNKIEVEVLSETIAALEGSELPTHSIPVAVPAACKLHCHNCRFCKANEHWWIRYQQHTDYILYKSNLHDHELGLSRNDKGKGLLGYCGKNKYGTCKAQFPRPCFTSTTVDPKSGHINFKKLEPDMNTVSHVLTYLLRCNTDVTCLLSGTAIKFVIAYITDYVSKNPLKTYMVFDTIKSV